MALETRRRRTRLKGEVAREDGDEQAQVQDGQLQIEYMAWGGETPGNGQMNGESKEDPRRDESRVEGRENGREDGVLTVVQEDMLALMKLENPWC